jgi:hypothetical protein
MDIDSNNLQSQYSEINDLFNQALTLNDYQKLEELKSSFDIEAEDINNKFEAKWYSIDKENLGQN